VEISIILAIIIGFFTCFYFFNTVNNRLAFKELFLLLYVTNYLLAPAIIYLVPEEYVFYKMRLPPNQYFYISAFGLLGTFIGINLIKQNQLFKPNIDFLKLKATINESVLKSWVLSGVLLSLFAGFFPGEIAYLIYLLSLIRYVGAFGLYIINPKINWFYILGTLGYEFINSLRYGMFHDFVMWSIFFIIYYLYIKKISSAKKIALLIISLLAVSFIQNSKSTYREALSSNAESGVITFFSTTKPIENTILSDNIFYNSFIINSLTRVNQGWILASVVDNMNRYQNFQGLTIFKEYVKAAFFPRILAPEKLSAGDKKIFNQFSGSKINDNTSMGLGIYADGYIAYGEFGVFIFGLFFGYCFALIFSIVSGWTSISPFFFLFIFPILNYAVRPDCELQTILGHMVKSVLIFSLLVFYYKKVFEIKLMNSYNTKY